MLVYPGSCLVNLLSDLPITVAKAPVSRVDSAAMAARTVLDWPGPLAMISSGLRYDFKQTRGDLGTGRSLKVLYHNYKSICEYSGC